MSPANDEHSAAGREFRPRFGKTDSFSQVDESGHKVRIEMVEHPRGEGRPPIAVITYVDERAANLVEYSYRRNGRAGWAVSKSRTTIFVPGGKTQAIIDRDYSNAVSEQVASMSVSMRYVLRAAMQEGTSLLSSLALPDAAYASETPTCTTEKWKVFEAAMNKIAAEAAVATAYLLSCEVLGPGCVMTIAGATAWAIAADTELALANEALWKCQHPKVADSEVAPSGGCLAQTRVTGVDRTVPNRISAECVDDQTTGSATLRGW